MSKSATVLSLMDTYYQWVPQPNGVFQLPSQHRRLFVEKVVLVVIEPCHISTITAQGGWVIASSGLRSETEEELSWGGDIHVVFGGIGVELGLMTMCFNQLLARDLIVVWMAKR